MPKYFEDTYYVVYDEAGLEMAVTKDLGLIKYLQDNIPNSIGFRELPEIDIDDFDRYIVSLNRSKDEVQDKT